MAGIGLFFVQREKGLCVVDEVVAGGAADSSGRISVGDVLLSVDGRPVDGVCVAMRFLPLVTSLSLSHAPCLGHTARRCFYCDGEGVRNRSEDCILATHSTQTTETKP